jgi:DNA-directed RNA polymerase subunit M/transcription elongation factor TFIIS
MATIVITCPECDKQIKLPAEAVGKKIRCKNCEHVFVVKPPAAREAISEAKTKPPAAPAKKGAKPAKPAPAAKPPVDDDDETGPARRGYGITDLDLGIRCPQCAAEMKNEEQVICLNCGYNKVTRERIRTRKVKEVTGSDRFLWLLPGMLAVLGVLLMIGYCFFHHFALPGIMIDNWDDLTTNKGLSRLEALKDDSVGFWQAAVVHPAIEVWLFVFLAFGAWKAGKFAYKRLVVNPNPPEIEES